MELWGSTSCCEQAQVPTHLCWAWRAAQPPETITATTTSRRMLVANFVKSKIPKNTRQPSGRKKSQAPSTAWVDSQEPAQVMHWLLCARAVRGRAYQSARSAPD